MSDLLTQLGITKEELTARIVERAAQDLLSSVYIDDEGTLHTQPSSLARRLKDEIKKQTDEVFAKLAESLVAPQLQRHFESLTVQQTNRYGEKKDAPITFTEYVAQKAESYLNENVNAAGEPKDPDRYGDKSYDQTRAMWLINKYLGSHIADATKAVVQDMNSRAMGGIEKAILKKLEEVKLGIKVSVS